MTMTKILRTKPFYLLFFPLLFVTTHFFSIVTPGDPINDDFFLAWGLNFLIALAFSLIVPYALFKLLSRLLTEIKSGLICALIIILIFFFGDYFLLVDAFVGPARVRWTLPSAFLIFLFSLLVTLKVRTLNLVNEYLNVLSFLLVVYVSFTLALNFKTLRPLRLQPEHFTGKLNCNNCPDIYFLVLDSYTSNKSLKSYFDFDNSNFVNKLQNFGFIVQDEATSTSAATERSLVSTLNFGRTENHLERYYKKDIVSVINKSAVVNCLILKEYNIHNLSLFDIANKKKYYSLSYDLKIEIIDGIFQNSIFKWISDYFHDNYNIYSTHINILSDLVATSREECKNPKFIYAHILAPHTPFVIDSLGQQIPFFQQKIKSDKSGYLDQIKGLNKIVYKAVLEVRRNSPKAIIIIQGDHGSRILDAKEEFYTVFLAYLLPDDSYKAGITKSNEIFEYVFARIESNY